MASIIRCAEKSDLDAICSVHRTSFGTAEGEEVAALVAALHQDRSAEPRLSLVAEDDGNVVGHILFTRVLLPDADSGGDWPAARILCPLAVVAQQQHKGMGSRLIQEGLLLLKRDGVKLVFVFGNPDYYSRHGFVAAASRGLAAPYPLPEKLQDAWMSVDIGSGETGVARGAVRCAMALSKPHYWR